MLEITDLNKHKTHRNCIPLLEKIFLRFGLKPLNSSKKWTFWCVKSISKEISLLDEPILSMDEKRNEVKAMFFITRRRKAKKLQLFRIEDLFNSFPTFEKDVTIKEAIEKFLDEKKELIPPIAVVCLGKINEDGKEYTGAFLYHVPADKIVLS
ncbi:MAG: hypothetical protein WC875_03045 [Candidatus Absconditabacterales bacterium]|jgi:hypothetical protein